MRVVGPVWLRSSSASASISASASGSSTSPSASISSSEPVASSAPSTPPVAATSPSPIAPTSPGVEPRPVWRPWFTHSIVAVACVLLLLFSFLEYRCRRRRQIEAKLHRLSKNRRFLMMRHYVLNEDLCFPPVLDMIPNESEDYQNQQLAPRASGELTPSQLPNIVGIPVDKMLTHPSHSGLFVMNLRHPSRRESRHMHSIACARNAVNSTIEA